MDVSAAGVDEITLELLAHGARAEGAVTDISSAESVAAAFAHFDDVLPPVVGLVNLAGIPNPVGLLDLEHALLWPQGHRPQRDQRGRFGAVGPAREDP